MTSVSYSPAALAGRSWDIAGNERMTYATLIQRIADVMLVDRRSLSLNLSITPIASVFAAAVAGEDPGFI